MLHTRMNIQEVGTWDHLSVTLFVCLESFFLCWFAFGQRRIFPIISTHIMNKYMQKNLYAVTGWAEGKTNVRRKKINSGHHDDFSLDVYILLFYSHFFFLCMRLCQISFLTLNNLSGITLFPLYTYLTYYPSKCILSYCHILCKKICVQAKKKTLPVNSEYLY